MKGSGIAEERARPGTADRDEELRLIGLIGEGDMDAFEQLYRIYHPRLSRFLLNLTRRATIVEEVLNDTMMAVWEGAHRFQGASKVSTWVFAIAYRKVMKALRQQDVPAEDSDQDRRASSAAGPDDDFGQHRIQQLLAEAMQGLSPEHRAVLNLTYFQEMGYREIAGIMQCPVDTVKTRMFHARRHLRRRMGGALADWV